MNSHTHFLVTLFYVSLARTYKCAISIEHNAIPAGDIDKLFNALDMPSAGSSKDFIHGLLPAAIQRIGPILELEIRPQVVVIENGDRDLPSDTDPYIVRLNKELLELTVRVNRLAHFLPSDAFKSLHYEEQTLLIKQHASMVAYRDFLSQRFSNVTSA